MASLKERLNSHLHEMIAERASLDEEIKQMRGVIGGLESTNGSRAARKPARRRTQQRQAAPPVSSEERGKQILEFVKTKGAPVTSAEVAQHLGISKNVARKHVENLAKAGGLKDAGLMRPEGQRGGRESKVFTLA